MPFPLAETFLSALPIQARAAWPAVEHLESRLSELLSVAAAAWPGVRLNPEVYFRRVASLCQSESAPDPTFANLNGSDLYLACACLCGDPVALTAFDHRYMKSVPNMLASLRLGEDAVADVVQELHTHFFVAVAPGQPALARYEGRGALLMWVRTAAIRAGLHVLNRADKRKRAELTEQTVDAHFEAGREPKDGLRLLVETRHLELVRSAFVAALATLPQRQRLVIRLHYLDGLTLDAIGKILGAHKSTISRLLDAARDAIREELRKQLREALNLSQSEADSLVDTLISQLELSLADVLSG